MNKKIIYGVVAVVVVVLGYLNYFADDEEIGKEKPVIETTNVSYKNDDYVVEAEKQKDYIEDKETGFEKAKAKVNDMLISGDNVFIDKIRNLALKNNIVGIAPNGWRFEADEAKYDKASDTISSDTGVTAINKEKGFKISGKKFLTNSKMSYIVLENEVKIGNNDYAIIGDKAEYSDIDKIVILSGNIRLEGMGKEAGNLDGSFSHLKFDMNSKVLTAWEPFTVDYKGVKLSADDLYFQQATQELKVTKNVVFETNGFKINVDSLTKQPNSDIININGEIKGTNEEYSFRADKGSYNTATRKLELNGNIAINSTAGEKVFAEKMIYSSNENTLELISDKGVKYTSGYGELNSNKIAYNLTTKEIQTEGKYNFDGDTYQSKGEKLYFNNSTKEIRIENGYALDKQKNQKASGNKIEYNLTNKDLFVEGNATVEDANYVLNTDVIDYKDKDATFILDNNYSIRDKQSKSTLKGTKAIYNKETGMFNAEGDVLVEGNGYVAKGQNLEFNKNTGYGKLNSKIEVVNEKDGVKITGDNFDFQKDQYMQILGNIVMNSPNLTAKTDSLKYDVQSEKAVFSNKILFNGKDENSFGEVSNGEYYSKLNKFVGTNFNGEDKGYKLSSNKIEYFTNSDKVVLINNVNIDGPTSKLKGSKVEYFTRSEIVKIIGNFQGKYNEFDLNGVNGEFNNKTGDIKTGKVLVKSNVGDRIEADSLTGNMNERILNLKGNIKGNVVSKGEPVIFKGSFAKLIFKNDGKYELVKTEVRKNAFFEQGDKELTSDYIDIDHLNNMIYAKDNTKLVVKDAKNGITTVTSNEANVNTAKNTADLIGNVHIVNQNAEQGDTDIVAQKGFIDQNAGILELHEKVRIENKGSVLTADNGTYNMKTKKIRANGNVFVDYKK